MSNKRKLVRWHELTKEQQSNFGNGCGPRGLNWLIYDWVFLSSCRRHDFAYGRGGNELDRWHADWMFYRNMLVNAWAQGCVGCGIWYSLMATLYYLAVMLFGWMGFDYGTPKTKEEIFK